VHGIKTHNSLAIDQFNNQRAMNESIENLLNLITKGLHQKIGVLPTAMSQSPPKADWALKREVGAIAKGHSVAVSLARRALTAGTSRLQSRCSKRLHDQRCRDPQLPYVKTDRLTWNSAVLCGLKAARHLSTLRRSCRKRAAQLPNVILPRSAARACCALTAVACKVLLQDLRPLSSHWDFVGDKKSADRKKISPGGRQGGV
jgi:hypothetical protein